MSEARTVIDTGVVVSALLLPYSVPRQALELAVSGQASHLISGDGDLLALNPFREIAVITPHTFLAMLAENVIEQPVARNGVGERRNEQTGL